MSSSRRRASLPVAARHRGAWLGIPRPRATRRTALAHAPRALHPRITHTFFARVLPGRRDEDIAPYRHYPRALYPQNSHTHYPPRLIARGGSPPRCVAWQVAHAESFACRGSVRGTVRGRAAHPARCPFRAAIYPRKIRTPHCLWRLATPWRRTTPRGALPRSRLRHQRQPPPARTIGRIALRPTPHQLADA